MKTCVYYYPDEEQTLKVNGEFVESLTPATIVELMWQAYEAGEKKEGFYRDNQYVKVHRD